jgi:hypothetical protein
MPRRVTFTVEVPAPPATVVDALVRAIQYETGLWIASTDPAAGRIMAKTGMGLLTYGENLTITAVPTEGGATSLTVESKLKFGLFDWGNNRKNIDRVLALLARALPAGDSSLPPPPS